MRATATVICKRLQPLTQNKIISPKRAQKIVTGYLSGNIEPLKELITDKTIPVLYMPSILMLKQEVKLL